MWCSFLKFYGGPPMAILARPNAHHSKRAIFIHTDACHAWTALWAICLKRLYGLFSYILWSDDNSKILGGCERTFISNCPIRPPILSLRYNIGWQRERELRLRQ